MFFFILLTFLAQAPTMLTIKGLKYVDCISSRRVRPTLPEYDNDLHLLKFQFWSSVEYRVTFSWPLLPGQQWSRMVVPVKISSKAQRDKLKNNSYMVVFDN